MNPEAQEHNKKGLSYFSEGNYTSALREFRTASELDDKNAEYPNNTGMCYMQMGSWKLAIESFKRALELKEDALYYTNLALAQERSGADEEAIQSLEKATNLDSKYFDAWKELGVLYYQKDKKDKALKAWETASPLGKDPEVENNIGLILMTGEKLGLAEAQFQKALSYDAKYHLAHYNLGILKQKQKDYAGAAAAYQKTIDLKATYFPAHYNLGLMLEAQGKKKEAISAFEGFLKVVPPNMAEQVQDARAKIKELSK